MMVRGIKDNGKAKKENNIEISDDEDAFTPLRPIFCLKKKADMEKIETREDCFILDYFNTDDDVSAVSKDADVFNNADSPDPDLSIVAEKGQVACRDYPHSRHVCVQYPLEKTPHENYCARCYCYVCDLAAPCKNWGGPTGHCHALDNKAWKLQRQAMRQLARVRNFLKARGRELSHE